ncbi:hypothetical protein A3860_14745 [Niastella vici]|uniref:Uncharacterized protein n=1 Tax=Niastella vici TaxID=1703345 RepID=A0A1V9G5C6_9BACT|nr:hypothetical protein [Niastella vici]OQP65849.1 hypothetical protein A3860_14745 [Niastella vici]
MNLDHYQFKIAPDYHEYEFYSDGPRGRIKKMVVFSLVKWKGILFYNLAFGDYIDELNKLNDDSVSNNGDRQKVLATVATIVIDFANHFPDALIFATGSTPARTRLYQMNINRLWDEVKLLFQIYGVRSDGIMELFRPNENYHGFYARRILH